MPEKPGQSSELSFRPGYSIRSLIPLLCGLQHGMSDSCIREGGVSRRRLSLEGVRLATGGKGNLKTVMDLSNRYVWLL